uniref:Band 7 domain-containing protein n=1 Tax=Helicotheca tamesis TaxID=374047 RepID=A0A7S2I310_9STRA
MSAVRSAMVSSSRSTQRIANKSSQIILLSSSHAPSTSLSSSCRLYSTTPLLFQSYSFDRGGGGGGALGGAFGGSSASDGTGLLEMSRWPITKTNTILNIVPQGKRMVVERFGKMHAIHESGYFFAIPLVDNIAYVIDVRERAIDILPQAAITRDNVSVEVSGNLFVRVVDPERSAYGARNPLYAVMQHAQSAMRSAIGEMELDEILHGRARLNSLIKGSLQEAAVAWGLEVRRYEITEITPDEQIRVAMDKQAAAERDRREQVLRAEGDKRRAELTSEGVKISLTNESEGTLVKIRNEAEAAKTKLLREAEGEAEAVKLKAQATAQAIAVVAAELQKAGGSEAARLALAKEFANMYGEMGSKSNTMIFNDRPADVTALLSQAAVAIKAVDASTMVKDREETDGLDAIEASVSKKEG